MKVAVIGSGISGLACAHYLNRNHQVHVLEREQRIGGHTATVDVALGGRRYAVDTGFIVYNDWTYPNFIALLDELGVSNKATRMSFSLSDRDSGLEYAGSSLNTLFAQRSNLVSPRFLRMVRDILRFNKESVADLEAGGLSPGMTLGEYLAQKRYSDAFRDYYLVPMGSAIWSADVQVMLDFPLEFFVRFFANHGLLNIRNRPQWRVVEGGSREYLKPLVDSFRSRIRTGVEIDGVKRTVGGAEVYFSNGRKEQFDAVVFACHSDQALKLLLDPSDTEVEILSAIPYQSNDVVLHTDTTLLPANPLAWSCWNYLRKPDCERATLTYNMNMLQGIDAPETFCVTLNDSEVINPHKILGRFSYDHPVFTVEGMAAQQRWDEINSDTTWFCGAYWRNGFHEDGVVSAMRVAQALDGGENVVANLGSAA
ncbi:FAD-dependent oxidoreductase [Halioglobus japonicus]|uniref:FAD-dependent oxidoreductase n=1 Tax=Halioglobus japonicus TaxID=930805 RepID=A0AAP8MEZ8_9GAMM|nr:FAD-dependent oxidoreductase [Halioglobus japonicus]AQA18577.1 FAD-dependent oxidoreductase [Halioglobus japonicus]PLW86601.1 FAD-dependent oxidoreductase [Halioglobus japonicus]GHD12034.1 amine oxidase [Halioglobus japonicus]